ncbi:hypothetical protein [Ruegeria sp. HKCCSP346]|uniref:AbiU2 domain-containing protein n=1 Tax=Ruegeria sp. HKCCSP346 TaxID=2794830 RepID=UPI001AE25C88|nr:hypothetical protein [Ruegeria sp. HKCCSP346]
MVNEAENLFEHLKTDFFRLRVEWRLYRSLWGTNKETFDMLQSISASTSQTLEAIVFERVLLGLRKLTDPPHGRRMSAKSVSIRALPKYFDDGEKTLTKLVSSSLKSSSFARNWSDKRIAHSDFEYRVGNAQLEPASRAKVEKALESIATIIKWIARNHFDTTLITHPIPPLSDERTFLRCLYEGKQEMERKRELSKQLSLQGRYEERNKLREMPDWLKRSEPPIDS